MLGSFYGHDFYGSGGQAPYSILVGSRLPRGLSAIAGMISGTPSEVGSFPIRVHATDINGLEASADYTLVVEAPSIAIFSTALSNARAGTFFFERIRGALGTEPYEFSVSSGAVPPGLSPTR
ncbi:Ig domain-containing protein [Devosia neptuniae]|uniref:Ig domain-containing protein n=1 Tax=Devosia neptuniae TaxID=191302 RepID=A0ABY6C882_9HYPH|nr:Ig domain-containing protein [Devosia neptuniae]UXN68448.1 Ig domain-containing protein [Devosia neptuniae]